MVDASITLLILLAAGAIVALVLHVTPERWLNVLWEKLHLDNDDPYDD